MLVVLLGGARSGKSRLAVELASRASPGLVATPPATFVATCPRLEGDGELAARIEAHRQERPSTWSTVEAEVDLVGAIAEADEANPLIVDCLTLWVGNLQHRGDEPEIVERVAQQAIEAASARAGLTVVVSNEVGLGIVPGDPTSRAYRDLLGSVNRAWVAAADRALFLVAGRAFALDDPFELLDN